MAASGKENGSIDRSARSRAIVVDVRPFNDFKLGTLPDSVNCPFGNVNNNDDSSRVTLPKEVGERLSNRRGKIVCVVGSGYNNESQMFAAKLLEMNFNRVSVLHKGIEIFRSAGVLCVPNT